METVKQIFTEYENANNFKASMGTKGLYEQSRINERFFIGDQWYGANCGNDRPLVRHNIIRRIGDYKISFLLSGENRIKYSAAGVFTTNEKKKEISTLKKRLALRELEGIEALDRENENSLMLSALSQYADTVSGRVGFSALLEQVLRNAFVSGTGLLYTYWDTDADTGLYAKATGNRIKGEIACQALKIENVCFGDPYCENVSDQPYIIIASHMNAQEVIIRARRFGAGATILARIENTAVNGKILVLTRLHRENIDGETHILATQVCKGGVIRNLWDTRLHRYPLAKFSWDRRGECPYGESEVTYLIPNQIALNRMITANVWSGMANGMPIMLVNGDTVTGEITNDPGQIIKIYGSNEDVSNAVKYVSPPDFADKFQGTVDSLIKNTLNQSGANEAALGEMEANNATAIQRLNTAAMLPLTAMRKRYHAFLEEVALIWADFWMTQYKNRELEIVDENGMWYLPFNAARYKNLKLYAKIEADGVEDAQHLTEVLNKLYDKGEIDAKTYVEALPNSVLESKQELIFALKEKENDRK